MLSFWAPGPGCGFRTCEGEEHALRPRIVVNAAGPWIDRVNATLGLRTKLIGGTKGSHILLDHPGLIRALKGRMIYFEADDGRICLVYDYLGRALVGSTDIRDDDPDTVRCEEEEIAYFLDSLRSLLPGIAVSRDQIVYTYSGIRPLPASDASTPGLISRDHSAPVIEASDTRPWPVISLVGGKWTTFRGFAEEVADTLLARLGHDRRVSTRDLPIGGGRGFPADAGAWAARMAQETGAAQGRAQTLLARYGTRAGAVLRHEGAAPVPLSVAGDYSEQEVDWLLQNERVVHLADLILRRTDLAVTGRLTIADLERMADLAALTLNWDARRRRAELRSTRAVLENRHGMVLR
ncbi:MAG: FAD-dependent oxidoreductase [Defluviimonas denitrificans]